jgi:hypothetical protein
MINRLWYASLLLSAAATASSAAHLDADAPPRANELDESYTFERYLVHFRKSYDDPNEYARRSRIFARNLDMILGHNGGKIMTEDGDIVGGGFVMGVNAFTDVDVGELPTGYSKPIQAAWRSHILPGDDDALRVERLLGGLQSYSVSDTSTSVSSTFHESLPFRGIGPSPATAHLIHHLLLRMRIIITTPHEPISNRFHPTSKLTRYRAFPQKSIGRRKGRSTRPHSKVVAGPVGPLLPRPPSRVILLSLPERTPSH